MCSLSNAGLLELWEHGASLHPAERAVAALQAAHPDTSYETLADWELGRRNRAHADLHCGWFGPRLEAWIVCPHCAERLEFQMDARSFAGGAAPSSAITGGAITVNGQSFRLPTSRDLVDASQEPDLQSGTLRLLQACYLDQGAPPVWTQQEIAQIGEEMALADPMAETRLTLDCPSCRYQWSENLDISAFFWAEVEARAHALLRDVHVLASAYGWTEGDILALSERRRTFYMERSHG